MNVQPEREEPEAGSELSSSDEDQAQLFRRAGVSLEEAFLVKPELSQELESDGISTIVEVEPRGDGLFGLEVRVTEDQGLTESQIAKLKALTVFRDVLLSVTVPDEEHASRLPSFRTVQDAYDWMYDQVDDSCIDNERVAFLDDKNALDRYNEALSDGCCGSFDEIVSIEGRRATIGCNFGH